MLISLIESALDGLIRTQIGKLILDPLLINYTGKARALIQDRMASCTAETQAVLRQVDAALEEYLNALGSISDLPELRPSDERREAYRRHQNRVMQEAYREAEKKSTFLSIVTKQTVLYGHATVSYFQDSSGSAQRQEVPLQEHVVEFEVPRMAHLDPLGLEYQLAVFRTERRAV